MRSLIQLIISWRLWALFRLHAKRIAVVGCGFFIVAYINGELEKLLILSENTDGQIFLIISKNLAYLGLVATFFAWPFFSSSKNEKVEIKGDLGGDSSSKAQTTDEPFDFIRRQGGIRKRSEIMDDIIDVQKDSKN